MERNNDYTRGIGLWVLFKRLKLIAIDLSK